MRRFINIHLFQTWSFAQKASLRGEKSVGEQGFPAVSVLKPL